MKIDIGGLQIFAERVAWFFICFNGEIILWAVLVCTFEYADRAGVFLIADIIRIIAPVIRKVKLEQGYVNGVVTFSMNGESATGSQKHKSGHKR